jgi:hypothetical protein
MMGSRIQSSFEWGRESMTAAGGEQAVASEDLKSLVLKLIAKVDTLTAEMAQQKHHSNTPNEDIDAA